MSLNKRSSGLVVTGLITLALGVGLYLLATALRDPMTRSGYWVGMWSPGDEVPVAPPALTFGQLAGIVLVILGALALAFGIYGLAVKVDRLTERAELDLTATQTEDRAWLGERALLDPAVRADSRALGALLAPEFHEIGQSGLRWTRAQVIAGVAFAHEVVEQPPVLSQERAEHLAPGLVLLTYHLVFQGRESLRSSLWRSTATSAEMVFHQGTSAPSQAPSDPEADDDGDGDAVS